MPATFRVGTELIRNLFRPVINFLLSVSACFPCVARPLFIPKPVPVNLQYAWRCLVGCIRPIPVRSLRIQVQTVSLMNLVHGTDGLLNKIGGSIAEWFEVGEYVYIFNLHGTDAAEAAVQLSPWASWCVG